MVFVVVYIVIADIKVQIEPPYLLSHFVWFLLFPLDIKRVNEYRFGGVLTAFNSKSTSVDSSSCTSYSCLYPIVPDDEDVSSSKEVFGEMAIWYPQQDASENRTIKPIKPTGMATKTIIITICSGLISLVSILFFLLNDERIRARKGSSVTL